MESNNLINKETKEKNQIKSIYENIKADFFN